MAKMKERNSQLKSALGGMATKERIEEVNSLPEHDSVNRQGFGAYSLSDELRLISMLNTLKLEPQFYRSENETMRELRDLIERIGSKDPYFVAQAIVYSRCLGEGMRSINHLAAALVSPFIAGNDYAKRFYGAFDKKNKRGGCIYRPDDMSEIKDVYNALNPVSTLANAMKKGFASVIEGLDTYQLAKYRKTVIDIANLSHPNSDRSNAVVDVNGEKVKALDLIMKGETLSADTWEVANSEAGQEVAKAIKDGKLDTKEAEVVLAEAKNDNWEALLTEGKLGILAALRNVRSMLLKPRAEVIDKLCDLVSNAKLIRQGKVMPYQIDLAYETVKSEFPKNKYAERVKDALIRGYETSIPNLKAALPGKTCVMVDCSGSMCTSCIPSGTRNKNLSSTACEKAGLIAATIAKATGADVVRFGNRAEFVKYTGDEDVFTLGRQISEANMGGTYIGSAFELIRKNHKVYDRIILLSDNEANYGCTQYAYGSYIHDVCSPYIYAVDLAAYGTTPVKNNGKVNYYYGYGYSMFDDIASKEFNPEMHIDKVRKVVI